MWHAALLRAGTKADMKRVEEIRNATDEELFGGGDEEENGSEEADPQADLAAALKDTNRMLRESKNEKETDYPEPGDDVPELDDDAEPEDIIKAAESAYEELEASVASNKEAEAKRVAAEAEEQREREAERERARQAAEAALSPEERRWREVARLEAIEDAMRGEPVTSTLEHCLAVSGQRRVRLQMLAQTRGGLDGDLDVDVRRPRRAPENAPAGPANARIFFQRCRRACRCCASRSSTRRGWARRVARPARRRRSPRSRTCHDPTPPRCAEASTATSSPPCLSAPSRRRAWTPTTARRARRRGSRERWRRSGQRRRRSRRSTAPRGGCRTVRHTLLHGAWPASAAASTVWRWKLNRPDQEHPCE